MKILKFLSIAIGALVVLFLLASALLPSAYKVERSIIVNAPVSSVYEEMRYFKNFKNWSPWYELDPEATITITGTDGEVGCKYAWSSKKENVGSGSLTRIKQEENKLLVSELYFADFGSTSHAGYRFEPADGGTKVTWFNEGSLPFMMRAMGLMMDGMMGKDFEKGLQKIKTYMEGSPA